MVVDSPVLYDREIQVPHAGAANSSATECAEPSDIGQRKRGRVEILQPSIRSIQVNGHASDKVGALISCKHSTGGIGAGYHIDRSAAKERNNPAELPISKNMARSCTPSLKGWQDVYCVGHKHLPPVEVCVAAVEIVVVGVGRTAEVEIQRMVGNRMTPRVG